MKNVLLDLTAILREAWNTSQQTGDNREKIQALSLAKECYSMKLDLLTNATVIDDAIRFTKEIQDKLTVSRKKNAEELKGNVYDTDKVQLAETTMYGNQETLNRIF